MVFNVASLSAILLFAIASLNGVAASPVASEYPEIVPGPGMPSLQSLGLTTKDLYTMSVPEASNTTKRDLFPRFNRVCNDNGCGRVARAEAQACVNYLRNLGTQACGVSQGHQGATMDMCTSGRAHISGTNYKGNGPVSSYCRDVAAGAQSVIDGCTDGNGNVAGADAAQGNGDLIVAIEAC